MENGRLPFSECTDYLYRLQRDELIQLCGICSPFDFDDLDYMKIETAGRVSKGEIISRIRENYVYFCVFLLFVVSGIYIGSISNYRYYVYQDLPIFLQIDTSQRLGKYKWYAHSLQAATESKKSSINPQ